MSNVAKVVDQPQQLAQISTINDSAALMTAVARAAADPSVDVEKMERLFAMHERMEAKQAERDYADAMTRAQRGMPAIAKERENKQTKSWYADMEAINKKIVPVYTAEGFSLSFGQADCPLEDCVRVTCDVLHSGGHSKHYFYDNPIDDAGIAGAKNKTPTHGRASATTYAQRYITKLIFNLTLGDEDDDGNGTSQPLSGRDMDWIATADALTSLDDYRARKAEVCAAYGDATRVPKDVLYAFNRRFAALKESAK